MLQKKKLGTDYGTELRSILPMKLFVYKNAIYPILLCSNKKKLSFFYPCTHEKKIFIFSSTFSSFSKVETIYI